MGEEEGGAIKHGGPLSTLHNANKLTLYTLS